LTSRSSSALYTTRLGLDTLVLDRGGGRAAMMTDTHNVIGVREDVTGNEFLRTAREQVTEYGGEDPGWSKETASQLKAHPVDVVDAEITGMNKTEGGWLESYEFADGAVREYRGGFPMLGSEYNADLVDSLGLERTDGGTVAVDDDGETSTPGVYAVGDLTPGHNQIPVAMGEGADAGIAIHMDLRAFPRSTEEIETEGSVGETDVPALSEELLATAISHEGHAGGPRHGDKTRAEETPADD